MEKVLKVLKPPQKPMSIRKFKEGWATVLLNEDAKKPAMRQANAFAEKVAKGNPSSFSGSERLIK